MIREEINAVELGKIVFKLEHLGYGLDEIAVKLGVGETTCREALNIYRTTPIEYADKVNIFKKSRKADMAGRIASGIAAQVTMLAKYNGLDKKQIKKVYEFVRTNKISKSQMALIVQLSKTNGVDKAIKKYAEYSLLTVRYPVKTLELNQFCEQHGIIINPGKFLPSRQIFETIVKNSTAKDMLMDVE